jgi:hypothetical protein
MEDRSGSDQGDGMDATEKFHCPHCGALYEKTDNNVVAPKKDRVVCVVCSKILYESEDPHVPTFKLIMRPEGDTE